MSVQTIQAVLPNEQVGALAEIAVATGSSFDEVLAQAVGYSLGDARHVFGVVANECDKPGCTLGCDTTDCPHSLVGGAK